MTDWLVHVHSGYRCFLRIYVSFLNLRGLIFVAPDGMILFLIHSMARANLKKSVWLVTNTTAASITYLRGPELASIEIPPFKPFL